VRSKSARLCRILNRPRCAPCGLRRWRAIKTDPGRPLWSDGPGLGRGRSGRKCGEYRPRQCQALVRYANDNHIVLTEPLMMISPLGEYLMALEIRVVTSCEIRDSSARMTGKSSGRWRIILCRLVWVCMRSEIRRISAGRETSDRLSESPPACRREASSRFSINSVRRSDSSSSRPDCLRDGALPAAFHA
jgi:hypothetical protein